MPISEHVRKVLWAQAAGLCALCRSALIEPASGTSREVIVGQECHIVARQNRGPRHGPPPAGGYDAASNVLLLCARCHLLVDSQTETFSVERLRAAKAEHERFVATRLAPQRGPDVLAEHLRTGAVVRVHEAPWRVVGVAPAIVGGLDNGEVPFVTRGLHRNGPERRLRAAVRDALTAAGVSVVSITGPSAAGKTRLAYEVLRSLCPNCFLIAPRHENWVPQVIDPRSHTDIEDARLQGEIPGVVVFLDDLELFAGGAYFGSYRDHHVSLTATEIRELALARHGQPVLILTTSGGKGRNALESYMPGASHRVLAEVSMIEGLGTRIPLRHTGVDDAALMNMSPNDAAEVLEWGIGPWAIKREALRGVYEDERWPPSRSQDPFIGREALALVDGLLGWRVSLFDGAVTEELAEALWKGFRSRRDINRPAPPGLWKLVLAKATSPILHGNALVGWGLQGALNVNDALLEFVEPGDMARSLHRRVDVERYASHIAPFSIGSRLHEVAPELAERWYRLGVDNGDLAAAFNLGLLLSHQDERQARDLLRLAASEGDAEARHALAMLLEGDDPEAIQIYEGLVAEGHVGAMMGLARMLDQSDLARVRQLRRQARQARVPEFDSLNIVSYRSVAGVPMEEWDVALPMESCEAYAYARDGTTYQCELMLRSYFESFADNYAEERKSVRHVHLLGEDQPSVEVIELGNADDEYRWTQLVVEVDGIDQAVLERLRLAPAEVRSLIFTPA